MNPSSKPTLISLLITLTVLHPVLQAASSPPATTLPTGGTFTAGSGNIVSSGNTLTINQNSLKGIIDWNNFSIGQASAVNFKNGSGATLNKVNGVTPTTILGRLLATGSIYLLNPQGILIGRGATIHTGGDFLATTLTLPNSAFLSNAPLSFSGSSLATVVNLGDLTSTGGNIYLIGHTVQNGGSITSPNGTTGLAAASQVFITDSSNNQKVAVQAPGGDVTNSGFINAAQAELKSNGGNIYALAGNSGGQIQATGTATQDGHIWLIATHGTTNVAGLISATNADGSGGEIETSGEHLNISKATIKTGRGGNWLLDPVDLTIDGPAANTIDTALATANVTLQTTSTTTSGPGNQSAGAGDININAPISWSANTGLTLDAYHGVTVNSPITASGSAAALNVKTNDGGAGGYFTAYAPITLAPTGSLTINNSAYTLINNSSDLQSLPLSGNFALNANLDLTQVSFSPIGYSSVANNVSPTPFSGVFEGLGHTLSNLTISAPSANRLGLFSYISTGSTVENLTLAGGSVTLGAALDSAGMLAGRSEGFIYNVFSSGLVNGGSASQFVGGLIGYNTGTLLNDSTTGAVTSGDNVTSTGGLVGTNFGSIWNSYASGAVSTGMGSLDTGGLVGTNSGSINGSYATGPVTSGQGSIATGGLAGSSAGPIADSYSTGFVTTGNASNSTGGLVGLNTLTSITSSYATGDLVVGSNSSIAGGLVGQNVLGSITASYATGSLQGGGGQEFGGFAGSSSGTVATSYATGGVTSSGSNAGYIGGFIGINANGGSIQQSYSTGTITAPSAQWVGGLVGLNQAAISDSYATGPVTVAGGTSIGGLVGFNAALATIATSYSTGAVTGLNAVGGLVGSNALSALTNVTSSFWDTVTSGQSQSLGGTGLSTSQWFSLGPLAISATGWNFTSTWVQGYPYPVLKQLPYVVSTLSSASRSYGAVNPTPTAASILDQNGNDATNRISGTATMVGASSSSNVGSYSVAATGQTVAGGYQLTYIPTTLTITPAQLTGLVSASNKVYDGTTTASATIVLTGVVGSDNISVTGATYSFATKNVGAGLAVSQTGGVLSGSSNLLNDYQFVSIASGSANITPLTLTVGGTTLAASKTYDGTAAATISGGSISAAINGDNVTFSQSGSFNDKNAAVGKTVTYTNVLSGTDAGNYSLSSTGNTLLASITPLALTVGGTTFAANKVYDSTTTASITGGSISGVISGDSVAFGQSGTFSNKNASLGKTVTYTNALSGTDAANYSLSSTGGTLTANLTPFALTVGGTTLVTTKVYDGTTSATVSGGSINAFSGDSVNFSQSGTFDNKNVGLGKTVTYNNAITGGIDAANYSLSSSGGNTTGNITPRTLTVGGTTLASSKAYDGTTQVSITGGTISSPIGGDLVSFTQSGSFANKNAGVSKTVIYNNVLSGTDAGNYLLSSSGGTISATITPLTLTVGGTTIAANKVYDGTTFASVSGGSISSALSGDVVNFSQSGAFSDKNVGTGKTVTYSNLLSGADAANYLLSSTGGTTTANITPAQLTATFVASNKVYDGTTTATASVSSLNGVIGADAVSLNATPTFNFSDKNAGTGKTVTASAPILIGVDAGNYSFSLNESGTASITPAQLTYVANTGISRSYGSANPLFSGIVTGLVPGDTLANSTTGVAAFTSPATTLSAPGTYSINGSGLTANHGNYLFTQAPGNSTALSVVGALNIAINSATGFVGQVPTFTATYTGPAINGLNITSLLAGLTYQITPAVNGPGTYKVTATSTAPAGFVFNIAPGTFTIIDNSPAVLPSSAPILSAQVPALFSNAAAASSDFLQPANSLGLFQVDSSNAAFGPQQQQPALSQSLYFAGLADKSQQFAAGAKP